MPDPEVEPTNVTYTIEELKEFIKKDPNPSIAFYGGEPLLNTRLIEKIIDEIPANHFILQTNGLLLRKIKPRYLHKIDTILISIDGRREVTDYYRGKGVYDKVIDNLNWLRKINYQGDVIARMAVSGMTDIYKDVKHLIELKNPHFDHVHWQLDVLWDSPPAQRYTNFDAWINNYNRGITKLVKYWLSIIERKRKVLGIVPFLGIMKTLLYNEEVQLRCGAGIDAFAITTSGRILACPIAPEFEWNRLGTIFDTTPQELSGKVKIEEPCTTCEYYHICGGRCLFANKTKLWGKEGFEKVCATVRHLIKELIKIKPKIERYIEQEVISKEEFDYPKYNNTTEIIP